MDWLQKVAGISAGVALGWAAYPASAGLETFANFTNTGSSYVTNSFLGQDGSTWTCAAARGDVQINAQTPTLRNAAAHIRSGTITGGVGRLTFKYRKPYSDSVMSNLVVVAGSGGAYTGMVTAVPTSTTAVLVFTAEVVNVEGDFTLLITNKAGCARISVDDIEWTGYSAAAESAPEFNANPGPISATVGVATAFTVSANGQPAPALALEGATASGGYSFAAGTGELSYTPSTNDVGERTFTFTASNSLGVATQAVSVAVAAATEFAPEFNANPGPISATVGVATAFTVIANGHPAPALALEGATASGGYGFAAGTGELSYTPPTNDVGERTFTFSASNALGVATQAVSVMVAAAPTTVPTVGVTDIGTNSFTVHWTAVTGATRYQVQIATDTLFTAGAEGSNVTLAATANSGLADGWSYVNGASNAGTYHRLVAETAPGVVSAEFSTLGCSAVTAGFSVATYGGAGANVLTISYSLDGGTTWVAFATNSDATSSTYVTGQAAALPAAALGRGGVRVQWHCDVATAVAGLRLQALDVTGVQASSGGSIVADETVSALTHGAVGLEMETTYQVRVRAEDGIWSDVVPATTAGAEPAAPWFTGGGGAHSATAGVEVAFTVGALGTPAPTLSLTAATAGADDYAFEPATGYFLYLPPLADGGTTQTFAFAASNAEGVAAMAATVAVAAAVAPTFGANPGPLGATTGVARIFAVSAAGAPEPVVTLRETTAAAGSYSFGAGALSYVAPTGDVGVRAFTFAASNLAGVSTQTVEVTVEKARALPTIDPLGALSVEAGQTTNVWVVAREADGDAVTLSAGDLPENAAFPATNGAGVVSNRFTFSPVAGQAGQSYEVVFRAGDRDGTNTLTVSVAVPADDPWADYYATCYSNGVLKTGDALKSALHEIIDGHTTFSYDDLWDLLSEVDECPTNSSMVQCLYLQRGILKTNHGSSAGQWNREHVWANSHGIVDTLPAYADAHHMHPTEVVVNSTRGNLDFDVVEGLSNSYSVSSAAFEPPDAGKGDVARAMFYMAVRYNGSGDGSFTSDLELTNAIPTSGARFGKLDTLLEWNELDAVNDYEIRRNNLIYTNYQKNRNPFVDHPEWARVVFDTNHVARPSAPAAFSAAPGGSSQVNLSFTANGSGDDVVVVWNETGEFTEPSGTPWAGVELAGGTVLCVGAASPQAHTGLTSCATHHYKCWSVSGTNYSAQGLTGSATTTGPDAPVSVWASATNDQGFTAAWSGVSGAAEYRLDVATGPSFAAGGGTWSTIFRETLGTSSGTTLLSAHEAADGFDNDGFTMTDGGAETPVTVRTTVGSSGYVDPAGNAASSNANVYFAATNARVGFAIEGIDTRGYDGLALSFGYRKDAAGSNMAFAVEWSTNAGATWGAVAVSNLPAAGAASGWYMVSNLAVSAGALESTGLSLRWVKTGGAAGRVDDILLQGCSAGASEYVAGYSNRTVSGTSQSVTGLASGATYYFRVASVASCVGAHSAVASVATRESQVAPEFGANPGPLVATVGVAVAFTVAATGSPAPTLALGGGTATGGVGFEPSTGVLSYTPPFGDIGGQSFTFTASNGAGVATQVVVVSVGDLPAVAPQFTSGAAFGATTGVERVFTVVATGYPAPTLALGGGTATGGVVFEPSTGMLRYAPPEADVGTQTFTFTASNGAGVATQAVDVAVAAGIPAPPALVWAAETNITAFTAAWSAAPLAEGYRLDVSAHPTFAAATGGSARWLLASNAATPAALLSNGWSGVDLGGTNFAVMTQSTAAVVSPAFSTEGFTNLTVDFWARTYGGTLRSNVTVSISGDDGTNWTVMGVVSAPSGSAWGVVATLTNTADLGGGRTRIRWQSLDAATNIGVCVSNLIARGWAPDTAPSHVPGYSNRTVSGTSQSVTGLTAGATCYFRVRSVNANGAGGDSPVAGVVTRPKAAQAIDFPEIGAQFATGVVELSATAGSGLPVTFAVGGGAAAISNGTTLTFTGAGTASVVASQAGDAEWAAAPDVTRVFDVAKAPAVVLLQGLAQTYDGTARAVTATTMPAGLAVEITYGGGAEAPTGAGSHVVTGMVDEALYQGESTGLLVVGKAALTVTADAKSKAFGAANPPLTFGYSGFVAGEGEAALSAAPVAETAVDASTPVGVHADAITVSGGAADNYAFAYAPADFTVTEAIASGTAGSDDVAVAFGPLAEGQAYELLYRVSLRTGEWTVVDSVVGTGETNAALTHVGAGTNEAGYYRIDGAAGPSAEVWGFVRMDKPGNAKLGVLGIPFATDSQTLNSLMDPAQFAGQKLLPGSADQIMIWNAGSQSYVNLALYQSGTNKGWKATSGFGPAAAYVNPVLPPGSAVWFRGSTNGGGKLTIAGEVVMDGVVTNRMVAGLQLVANPFSDSVALNELDIHKNATGQKLLPGSADQIMIWDAGTQGYQNLALYQSGTNKGWKLTSGFGPGGAYVNPALAPGRGFWFRVVNSAFDWVETNAYKDHLE